CRNGSDAELLGTSERASVHHILDDDLGRRTGLSPHYVDYLFAKRASCAEYFHLVLAVHSTLHTQIVNHGQSMLARRFSPPWSVEELDDHSEIRPSPTLVHSIFDQNQSLLFSR